MSPPPPTPKPYDGAEHQPLDADDFAILAAMRTLYEAIDPPPLGLVDRIRFALELHDIEAGIRLDERQFATSASRGADRKRTVLDSAWRIAAMAWLPRFGFAWLASLGRIGRHIGFDDHRGTRSGKPEHRYPSECDLLVARSVSALR